MKTKVTITAELKKLTRPELHERRLANVLERKRLSDENKLLVQLWKSLSPKTTKPTVVKKAVKKS